MKKKIGVLTCGRSDLYIYKPLIEHLIKKKFDISILAFGSHSSVLHGETINEAKKIDGIKELLEVCGYSDTNTNSGAVKSMSNIIDSLNRVWNEKQYDFIFALGDRFEMVAAVLSSVPYHHKVVHFHGGEKSFGSLDNKYRHAITSLSDIHFASTETHSSRIKDIIEDKNISNVYNIGSLALNNLLNINSDEEKLLSSIKYKFGKKNALVCFHPTLEDDYGAMRLSNILESLTERNFNILITSPNNDPGHKDLINVIDNFLLRNKNAFFEKNLGGDKYFSFLKKMNLLVGNSSSGIIEAASLGTYVINIGNRQDGRAQSPNTFNIHGDDLNQLKKLILKIEKLDNYSGENIYFKRNGLEIVEKVLRNE